MRVLVTGASRGIGAGIARKLAEDARQCGRPLHLAVAASRPGEGPWRRCCPACPGRSRKSQRPKPEGQLPQRQFSANGRLPEMSRFGG